MSIAWKCPKYGVVLRKGSPFLEEAIKRGSIIYGTATCANCGAKYNQDDIRKGKYDVPEPGSPRQTANKTFFILAEEISMHKDMLLALLNDLPISDEFDVLCFRCIRCMKTGWPGWPMRSEFYSIKELVDDIIESVMGESCLLQISEREGFFICKKAHHLRFEYWNTASKWSRKGFWIIRAEYSFLKGLGR